MAVGDRIKRARINSDRGFHARRQVSGAHSTPIHLQSARELDPRPERTRARRPQQTGKRIQAEKYSAACAFSVCYNDLIELYWAVGFWRKPHEPGFVDYQDRFCGFASVYFGEYARTGTISV